MHDFKRIEKLRADGLSWQQIAEREGVNKSTLHSRYLAWRQALTGAPTEPRATPGAGSNPGEQTRDVTHADLSKITTLEDLAEIFDVDPDEWEVERLSMGGSSWDQSVKDGTVAHSYKVSASFRRRPSAEAADARRLIDEAMGRWLSHTPPKAYGKIGRPTLTGDPAYLMLAIFDPHLGMLAWSPETRGPDWDLRIAASEYDMGVEELLKYTSIYETARIGYIVGHDFFHVDAAALPGGRGGATRNRTPQDIDGRRDKMFMVGAMCVVRGVDKARLIAPVDIHVVRGNHDHDEMFRLGMFLQAWYRSDPEVTVHLEPAKRTFFGWGSNTWMFTHGEEYGRTNRAQLPLIMATECPPEIWLSGTHREILTGHNHKGMAGRYLPTSDLDEMRSIRTRSLMALTPEDEWHTEQGYSHRRGATILAYRESGGLMGYHEWTP